MELQNANCLGWRRQHSTEISTFSSAEEPESAARCGRSLHSLRFRSSLVHLAMAENCKPQAYFCFKAVIVGGPGMSAHDG